MHVKTNWTVSIPTLETERLRLRTWQASDFDTYAAFKSDPELQRYFLGGTKNREEAWEDFCAISGQWILRGIGAFLVADLKTDEPRGFAGFWYPLDIEVPELCWALFPGNMKQGFATEAASAARQWLYTTQFEMLLKLDKYRNSKHEIRNKFQMTKIQNIRKTE